MDCIYRAPFSCLRDYSKLFTTPIHHLIFRSDTHCRSHKLRLQYHVLDCVCVCVCVNEKERVRVGRVDPPRPMKKTNSPSLTDGPEHGVIHEPSAVMTDDDRFPALLECGWEIETN